MINIFNFDTEGTELNVWFDSNIWDNLEVTRFIFTNGPLSMYHNEMNLLNDSNYINATDPLYIELSNMLFYNFKNNLNVARTNSAVNQNLPTSMNIVIQDSIFAKNGLFFSFDLNETDIDDEQVIYIHNMRPSDQ